MLAIRVFFKTQSCPLLFYKHSNEVYITTIQSDTMNILTVDSMKIYLKFTIGLFLCPIKVTLISIQLESSCGKFPLYEFTSYESNLRKNDCTPNSFICLCNIHIQQHSIFHAMVYTNFHIDSDSHLEGAHTGGLSTFSSDF